MCALACLIGVLGAGAAFALQAAIVLATNLFFYGRLTLDAATPVGHHLGLLVVLIPPLGGVLVGLLARYGSSAIRGHGIPEAMETVLVARSRIAPRMALLKPLATAISIGSGGPFGAEGPIIQSGGALGSVLGQLLRLTAVERKILLAAGAAAGMAATFGAPVAAVFLVVELLLFEFRARSLLPVALASAVAAGLRWAVLGPEPLFPAGTVHQPGFIDLPLFALLGLCAGLLAVCLSRAIYLIEDAFDRLALHWMWWPALGGIAVGLIGLIFPEALGVGAEHVRAMVAGRATLGFLLAMLICKTAAWTIALGSSTSGGVLGPLLLMGGSLGGVLAFLGGAILPLTPETGLWASVCMAAVFAGATRTPLTAVVFVLELTHEAGALLPLLVACTVSDLVSVALLRHSLMTEKIARRGVPIGHEYERDALASLTVAQVMTTDVEAVPLSLPLRQLWERFHGDGKHQGYPVVDAQNRLVGVVTRSDLPALAREESLEWLIVQDVLGTRPVVVTWPEEPLREAADRMLAAGVGRLPVVVPEAPDRVVGLLSRSDVLKALARRAEEENRRERLLDPPSGHQAA
jgi:H+/Cl- antiporter ClcA/predicted transcriptional regulator